MWRITIPSFSKDHKITNWRKGEQRQREATASDDNLREYKTTQQTAQHTHTHIHSTNCNGIVLFCSFSCFSDLRPAHVLLLARVRATTSIMVDDYDILQQSFHFTCYACCELRSTANWLSMGEQMSHVCSTFEQCKLNENDTEHLRNARHMLCA